MKDIVDNLDETLLGLMPNDGIQFNGLCQQVIKGEQVHPVTIEDKKQVAINDNWDVITFHRLNGDASFPEGKEQDFGRSTGRKRVQPMRMFIAHKVNKGEEWIDTFTNNFPLHLTISDTSGVLTYEFVELTNLALGVDQVAIYQEEFGENSYENHIQDWNIYALFYDVEFIKC